jgi:glycosyltransferase involved in cell wall biosynthesis
MTFYLANFKSLDNEYLNSLFSDLENRNYRFVSGPCLYDKNIKKAKLNKYLFSLLLPYLIFKAKKEIKELIKKDDLIIICASWPERIIFSCLLKIYRKERNKKDIENKKETKEDITDNNYSNNNTLKVQWWFLPNSEIINDDYSAKAKRLLKKYPENIKIICFHKKEKEKLEKYYTKEKDGQEIFHFPLLSCSHRESHQESIFDNLSKSKSLNFFHRYFNIVVLADLKEKNYTETIIKALPDLLRAIPSAQLLIIGLNKDNESLKWLAKKLAVEKNVWFLNEKDHINEWLDTANLFILSNDRLSLSKYYYLLLALSKSLPIITLKEQDISYLIKEKKCSIESKANVDDLISAIISLYRDPIRRKVLANNSYYLSTNSFNLDKNFKRLQDILK